MLLDPGATLNNSLSSNFGFILRLFQVSIIVDWKTEKIATSYDLLHFLRNLTHMRFHDPEIHFQTSSVSKYMYYMYMGQISEEMQQVIRSGTFFCFLIINFGHLESL